LSWPLLIKRIRSKNSAKSYANLCSAFRFPALPRKGGAGFCRVCLTGSRKRLFDSKNRWGAVEVGQGIAELVDISLCMSLNRERASGKLLRLKKR
jgi:hypothetical protein